MSHVAPTLKLLYFKGHGLGICSEQAGESIHSYFKDHFRVHLEMSTITHPQYMPNLKEKM